MINGKLVDQIMEKQFLKFIQLHFKEESILAICHPPEYGKRINISLFVMQKKRLGTISKPLIFMA